MEKPVGEEVRAKILRELAQSGLSAAAFCRERGLSLNNVYHWQQKARAKNRLLNGTGAPTTGSFALVQTGITVTIEVGTGVRLVVPLEGLKAVLKELGVR